jgi:hypothetical protein
MLYCSIGVCIKLVLAFGTSGSYQETEDCVSESKFDAIAIYSIFLFVLGRVLEAEIRFGHEY